MDRNYISLLPPNNPMLNNIAVEVDIDSIKSNNIQYFIDSCFALASGKGHNKNDTRQMVGLAAPQVGNSVRIIFIDTTADGSNKKQNLEVFINPQIVKQSKNTVIGREGCWSCDNVCGIVERSEIVEIKALDRNAKPVRRVFTEFIARIAQHEIDHLNGIRFPDRIPIDEPENLHWVAAEEFARYREAWPNWPNKCPRDRWDKIKNQA